MGDNPYDGLVKKLDQFPSGAPDTPELRGILETIFTEEEAEFAVSINLHPFREPAEDIAKKAGMNVDKAVKILERMADKGLVYAGPKDGQTCYSLLPLVPGIFELQFMKGEETEKDRKLARLFNDYYNSGWGKESWSFKTPFARAVAVQETLPSESQIQSYDKVRELIEKATKRALTICFCRHEHELIGDSCGRPKDVCMVLGPFADYAVERGFAWRVSKDEMLEALDRAEDAGLVHVSDNIKDKVNFICNCCGCCCGILGTMTRLGIKEGVGRSSFILSINWDACDNCGACAKKCQVDALTTEGKGKEKKLIFDESLCLGCGVCLPACKKKQAIVLIPREDAPEPKDSYIELGYTMVQEMNQKK